MSVDLSELGRQFENEAGGVCSEDDIRRLKSAYLGKQGYISGFLKKLGDLPAEERPAAGSQANDLKRRIEELCRSLVGKLAQEKRQKQIAEEAVDVTLPGRQPCVRAGGGAHPLSLVMDEVERIFRGIGFSVHEGPEVETDYYNFEALNIPADHPARDMQDTFYLARSSKPEELEARSSMLAGPPLADDNLLQVDAVRPAQPRASSLEPPALLLRTHTSPVQIHVMQSIRPPIRMIAPGAVYRRDSDISHTPMFHQVEGLVVDTGIQFSHLKGVVTYFLHQLFSEALNVRFRPSYFPFTEPSAEVDIQCVICEGKKVSSRGEPCRLCKQTGWLEVMGCGMVHPNVFKSVGYDRNKVTGFAFGMGIERLTMLKFGIPDIRLFFENDLRFLRQF